MLYLAKIREDEGKVDEAAKILQDVQVQKYFLLVAFVFSFSHKAIGRNFWYNED